MASYSIRFQQLAQPLIQMLEYRKKHLPVQHPLHIMFYDEDQPAKTGHMAQTVYLFGSPGERHPTTVSNIFKDTRTTCRAYTTWAGNDNTTNYLFTTFMYNNLDDDDDAMDCPVRGTAYFANGDKLPICGYSHNLFQPELCFGELGNENGQFLPKEDELFFAQNATSCVWIYRVENAEYSLIPPDPIEMMSWNNRIAMWEPNPYGDFNGDYSSILL